MEMCPGESINCKACIRLLQKGTRDVQVNYKNVMKEYKLGPNGGILTSCNLFATRFDQVSWCPTPNSAQQGAGRFMYA